MNYYTASTKVYLGIFWKITSCCCFAGANALVRYLSGGSALPIAHPLPIYTLMFFQNVFGCLLILPIMGQNKVLLKSILQSKYLLLHGIRLATAAIGIGLWYLSLQYLPLAQAVAVSFIAPFVTILGAIIFLGEQVTIIRISIILLSVIGGYILLKPMENLAIASGLSYVALLPLFAALIFAIDKIIAKKLLIVGETPSGLTLVLIAGIAPLCLLPAIVYGWHTPAPNQWGWLMVLAVLGVGAHFAFNKAFSYAEVTLLMPFSLTKMLFCGLIGYVVFAEIPQTINIWIGLGITTTCAVMVAYDKRPVLAS